MQISLMDIVKPQNARVQDVKHLYKKTYISVNLYYDCILDVQCLQLGEYTYVGKTKRLDPNQKCNSRLFSSTRNVLAYLHSVEPTRDKWCLSMHVLVRPNCSEEELTQWATRQKTNVLNQQKGNASFCAALYIITTTTPPNEAKPSLTEPKPLVVTTSLPFRRLTKHLFRFLHDMAQHSIDVSDGKTYKTGTLCQIVCENALHLQVNKLNKKMKALDVKLSPNEIDDLVQRLNDVIEKLEQMKIKG